MSEAYPPKQEKFIQTCTGEVRGRYILAVLSSIGILGDEGLKEKCMEASGRKRYDPFEMYPVQEFIKIMKVAIEAGIPAERFGQQVIPAFKRGYPELFESKDFQMEMRKVEELFKKDTTYGGIEVISQGEKSARFKRADSPLPCGHTIGVLEGLLKLYNVRGQVTEIKCQWKDDVDACEFEATWEVIP